MRMLCSLCALMLTAPAFAASFNCAKAATTQEKAICASGELSAADDRMAAAYRAVLHRVPASFQEELRADQRMWIRRLAIDCPAGNPEQRTYLESCILGRENARTDALKQMFMERGGIEFAWHAVYREAPGNRNAEDPADRPGSLEASWPEALSDLPELAAWNRGIAEKVRLIAGLPSPTASSGQSRHGNQNRGWMQALARQ